jgi:TonB family protein
LLCETKLLPMKMIFRNSYLHLVLLLVIMVLSACSQEKESPNKKAVNQAQKKETIKQETLVVDNKINNESTGKIKYEKIVPIVKVPAEPFPEPYPDPIPEPYPFPEPPIVFPEPKQLYEPKQEEILDIAEVQPEFPGGTEALMKFIQTNINYPQMEKEQGIEGKVYVGFVVMKSGEITNIKIMRGIKDAPSMDKEAIRIVKLMPHWIPGMNNGQKVNTRTIVPIRFSLD